METKKLLETAGPGVAEALAKVDPAQVDAAAEALAKANRVFAAGWGRAGNVGRILGMDMSQLGKIVYCVGDNSTPSIHAGDVLAICSGSGNTKTMALIAQQAKEYGATVILISGNADSTIGKIADINVVVPRRTDVPDLSQYRPKEPMGNKGLGIRVEYPLPPEVREQMPLSKMYSFYHIAFMLNEVIQQKVMEKLGGKYEDIMFYHNNLE